jgi:hypothetical protein
MRTGTSYGTALLATLVWAGVNLAVTLVVAGGPPSSRAAGALVGSLLASSLLAALITWLVARRRPWAFPQLVALALPFFLLFRLLSAVGRAAG